MYSANLRHCLAPNGNSLQVYKGPTCFRSLHLYELSIHLLFLFVNKKMRKMLKFVFCLYNTFLSIVGNGFIRSVVLELIHYPLLLISSSRRNRRPRQPVLRKGKYMLDKYITHSTRHRTVSLKRLPLGFFSERSTPSHGSKPLRRIKQKSTDYVDAFLYTFGDSTPGHPD